MNVLDRFLKYVQYDTRSDETSKTYPSTDKQLILLRDLATELREIGLTDAAVDEHSYVMATIPATTTKTGVPTIGFIAHVDTSPEMPGTGVKPIVHRAYDGRDLVLPDDPSAVLRLADNPPLAGQLGHDIVTASGTTLLGADDKAGVAEIVTAAAHLVAHPEIPHGTIRIAFTMRPFAKPGWVLKPWKVSVIASAEKLSTSISPREPPSIVYAQDAPNRATSKCCVPRPISSSGVNAMRTAPCGRPECDSRYSAAVMISATPALSSAPSSVVPEAVTMSWPI